MTKTNQMLIDFAKAIEKCESRDKAILYYNMATDFVDKITEGKSANVRDKIVSNNLYPMADYIIKNF